MPFLIPWELMVLMHAMDGSLELAASTVVYSSVVKDGLDAKMGCLQPSSI